MRHLCAALLLLASPIPLAAHEFWIDPQEFAVPEGAPLVADLRVGEKLDGAAYAYVPINFKRFEIVMGDTVLPVEGRAGDRPALNTLVPGDGLAIVVHQTRDYRLTYTEWQKFIRFCTHKDFPEVVDQHLARGLSQDKIRERYTRFGKSLMAVGAGQGADREVGLRTEIVALANPYTDDLAGGLPVQVLHDGAPRADVQVELFERAPSGEVAVRLYRTDADGRAEIDVSPGHMYLVDSVVMLPLDMADEDGAAWESLWASLTFEVPE